MGMNQGVKVFFGIFMVFVYLGMAVLMAINFFDWSNTALWTFVRWLFAVIFGAYGLYRCYREIKGEHSYGMRQYDADDKYHYTTYGKSINNKVNDEDKE